MFMVRFEALSVLYGEKAHSLWRKFMKNNQKILHCCIFEHIINLHLPVDCQLKIFDQTITPILVYGSKITGFENLNALEKSTPRFLKKRLKDEKQHAA